VFGFIDTDFAATLWVIMSVGLLIWRAIALTNRFADDIATQRANNRKNTATTRPGTALATYPAVQTSGHLSRRAKPDDLQRSVVSLAPLDTGLPLDEQIEVAGPHHHIMDIKAVFREAGKTITTAGVTLSDLDTLLVPEPSNNADPNAVAVVIGGHHIGYIPARKAPAYSAPLLRIAQSGHLVVAKTRLWAKVEDGAVRARGTLLAPEAQALAQIA